MKRTDLIYTGGFPLTQNRLGELQTAYMEAFHAMLTAHSEAELLQGVIISGMAFSRSGDIITITNGWFACKPTSGNAQLIRFVGATISCPIASAEAYVSISDHGTAVHYNNGSSHDAVVDRYAVPVTGGFSGVDAVPGTKLFFDHMNHYGRPKSYAPLEVDTGIGHGSVEGVLYHRKNMLGELHIMGTLLVHQPNDFLPLPDGGEVLLCTIPPEVAMLETAGMFFSIYPWPIFNSSGFPITHLRASTNGSEVYAWLLPSDEGMYTIDISIVVPLL